jgi:hypothetical protein
MSLTVTPPATATTTATGSAALTDQPAASCLNCGYPVAQRYCGYCGQDVQHTQRFTLRYLLLHDLVHSIWHVDKGVLYTLKQMLTRPGAAIQEYMAGRRAQHFRPITYLLLLSGVSMVLLNMLDLHPKPQTVDPDMPKALVLALEQYLNVLYKYPGLVYGVLTPLNALLAWWLLRPSRLNYAEMLLAQAFISGTLAVLSTIVMLPLTPLFREPQYYNLVSTLSMLPTLVYSTWVHGQLLSSSGLGAVAQWARALGTSVLQLVLLFLSSMIFLIVVLLHLLRSDPVLRQEFKAKFQPKAQAAQVQPSPRR